MRITTWIIIFILIKLSYPSSSSSNNNNNIDILDSINNLGRSPIISEWEKINLKFKISNISNDISNILEKVNDFKYKGKYDKIYKIYNRLLNDTIHPDILCSFGEFIEETSDDIYSALYYYIYSIHISYIYTKAVEKYIHILPFVKKNEQKLFQLLDTLMESFTSFDLSSDNSLDIIHNIQKRKRIEQIYHTNAIEGNTLSLEVTGYIIETGKTPKDISCHISEINEVWGTLEAFEMINYIVSLSFKPLDNSNIIHEEDISLQHEYIYHHRLLSIPPVKWESYTVFSNGLEIIEELDSHLQIILQIHRKVLGRVMPDEAGVYRHQNVSVGGYIPPNYQEIPTLMDKFVNWLHITEHSNHLHTIERAALAHFQLTWIHPFQDGNGRTARMLMNLILMSNGYPAIIIKLDDRPEYYNVLRKAQQSGDTRPFIHFIYKKTYQSISEYIAEFEQIFDIIPTGKIDLDDNIMKSIIIY